MQRNGRRNVMNAKHILFALALALVFSSSGSAQDRITVVDRLEEALRDCDWKSRNMTGAPKGRMLMHKRTMEDVLEALNAGREVDSRKLEEALKGHAS
jgi:hypothetical protein